MTPDKSDNPGQTLAVRDRIPGQDRTPPYKGVRLSGCPNWAGAQKKFRMLKAETDGGPNLPSLQIDCSGRPIRQIRRSATLIWSCALFPAAPGSIQTPATFLTTPGGDCR